MEPHSMFFDESYNELHYRYESALAAAEAADCLLVVPERARALIGAISGSRCRKHAKFGC